MKSKLFIIAITSLTTFALAADGDKKPKKAVDPAKRAEMIIKTSDKDGNGTVSKAEYANSKMGKTITEKRGADALDKCSPVSTRIKTASWIKLNFPVCAVEKAKNPEPRKKTRPDPALSEE